MRVVIPLIFSVLSLTACNKINLNNAEGSLQGDWQVVRVEQSLGERTTMGVHIDSSFEVTGHSGQFQFEGEMLSYSYRIDSRTFDEMNTRWELTRTKVNAGFTREERYTLSTPEQTFSCRFGDETSDAERDATEVRLSWETTEIGEHEIVTLYLEKQ